MQIKLTTKSVVALKSRSALLGQRQRASGLQVSVTLGAKSFAVRLARGVGTRTAQTRCSPRAPRHDYGERRARGRDLSHDVGRNVAQGLRDGRTGTVARSLPSFWNPA